eukprot:CAMPEP_0170523248 /NCGR_PEP_ID=MMETSP0209-20121228/8695_1 /TAXON_ID=665100 ORGANISM="Litonotus pictus, Strain P1" /NCGR_SAMPLE_ID=MMETSP0209 /ASSEMBLY_ACC=CAM_ASM_000301 /LENGTH=294 /DNA_ID=CAMNT_0010811255 /DNA_START=28 /DNA_END=912 /DNA_ORIENTATION=+
MSTDQATPEQDKECKRVINTKDYYEVLNIDKGAGPEDIRRAYKKLAVKLHPDRNKSALSTDAFKKVGHIYQVLTNDEKKTFYDKYGPEEEVRDRMHQQQQQYYTFQDDQDPFEMFRMFFGGMDGQFEFQNGRVFRREMGRRQQQRPQREREPVNRYSLLLSQLLPLILIFMLYVLPYLLQSTPLYAFEKSGEFYIKKLTTNKAEFYASDNYEEKYNLNKMTEYEKKTLFREIEYAYFEFLQNKCSRAMKQKQELQYKLYYYQNYPRYAESYQRELNRLDMSYCNKYNAFSQFVR